MRENRLSGSEGGAAHSRRPYPYHIVANSGGTETLLPSRKSSLGKGESNPESLIP
jgi:hypothetical protein